MNPATQGFSSLSAQHAQLGRRRIAFTAAAATLIMATVITFVIDTTRTNSARRYALAVRGQSAAAEICDASLSRHRLWIGPIITVHDLCVQHSTEIPDDFSQPWFSFFVVGDWGRDGMCCQRDVAMEMSILAERTNPDFIVGVGDNFYEKGIESANDEQVNRSWRSVYINQHESLQRPWMMVLGNHDYEGNADAQVQLSKIDPHWHMPESYYFEEYAGGKVFIAFIDTTCMYYTADEMNRFRGDGTTSKYRDEQLDALKRKLDETSALWKIVIGHHPFYSASEDAIAEMENQAHFRATLAPIFVKYGVATYISGHEHLMEHYDADGLQTFVSGAGSKVRAVSVRQPKSIFSLGRQGFLQVALRNDTHVLHMRFFDMAGAIVHTAQVTRPT